MRMSKPATENRLVLNQGSVWLQIINSLAKVRSVFAANGILSAGLKTFTLKLVESATEEIGWDFRPDDDYLTGQLRALLILTAGGAGHQM